jgi:outer membrane protein assembly factor BamB
VQVQNLNALPAAVLCLLALAADWPQFLGPARNGRSPETGLLTSWRAEGPPRLWEKTVGSGFSAPVVSGSRLVLFHRIGNEEIVQCFDAATGQDLWKHAYASHYQDDFGFDDGPRSTPLIAGERVFTLGAEGVLSCLHLISGKEIWQRNLNADYQVKKGFFGVATSPILEESRLLVNVGGRGAGIVAFDGDTGKELWKATDHEASYSSPVAATLQGRRTVVFFTREGIVMLDPRDGVVKYSKHWRARLHASVNAATPLIDGDYVFVSACYGTGAILLHADDQGVQEIWHGDGIMSNHYSSCVTHQGFLYGFDGRQEEGAKLRCVELMTGKERWTCDRTGCGSIIVAEGKLIILNELGELIVADADPEAYRERARLEVLKKPCRSGLALANGKLYARGPEKLVCWNFVR